MQKKLCFWHSIWNKIKNFLHKFFILPLILLWSSLNAKSQKKLGVTELGSSEMMQLWPWFSCFSPHFHTFLTQMAENSRIFHGKIEPRYPQFFWLLTIRPIQGNILWSIKKFCRKLSEIQHVKWKYHNTLTENWITKMVSEWKRWIDFNQKRTQ